MSDRREFIKTFVAIPVASALWARKASAFEAGGLNELAGPSGAEWVMLQELPAVNPRQSGVLRVITSSAVVHKNHGWWTGLQIPLTNLDNNPLKIGSATYTHGLACAPPCKIVVQLPSAGKAFTAIVGVKPENASGTFTVTVGDQIAFKSGILKGKMEGIPVNVDLAGAREFTLEIGMEGIHLDGWSGRGKWANAKVTLADGREVWLDEMLLSYPLESGPVESGAEEKLNLAPFGYVYRPDRPAGENPPETQFLNSGSDAKTPLGGILWTERRPVRRVELRFPAGRGLEPKDTVLRLLAGSWWKVAMSWNVLPLEPIELDCTAVESNGATLVFELESPVLASHLSVYYKQPLANSPIPEICVFSDSALKKMKIEIEWGLKEGQERRRFDGRLEAYNGRIEEVGPLPGKSGVSMDAKQGWRSVPAGPNRRGITTEVSYVYNDAVRHGNFNKTWWPNRTAVTVWTSSGSFSFVPRDLENGEPIYVPSMGFFVRKAGTGPEGREYAKQWAAKGAKTVRQMVRERQELTLDETLDAYFGKNRPPIPAPGDDVKDKSTLAGINLEPGMRIAIPDSTVLAAWRLAYWHLKRRALDKNADGDHIFTDYFYPPIGFECTTVFEAMDSAGCEEEITRTGFGPWFKEQGKVKHVYSVWKDVDGTLLRATGDAQEESCSDGAATMLYAMARHYQLTGNKEWVKSRSSKMQAACQWIIRQRQWWASRMGPNSLSSGLFPACGTGDGDTGIDPVITQATEAWEYNALKSAADMIADVDPASGAALQKEAEAFRQAILVSWDKATTWMPVIKVKDGTYRRFTPSIPYMRALCHNIAPPTNAGEGEWTWLLDGNFAMHLALGVLPAEDPRLDESLDVVEDNFFYLGDEPHDAWFSKISVKYLGLPAMCMVATAHLCRDDVPNFLRATFTQYGCEINPQAGYVFREGPGGGNDKIQETAAFLQRVRSILVMEDRGSLWLARATPRAWLAQGKKISVQKAPSDYGPVGYEIVSDVDNGKIRAEVEMPSRRAAEKVWLRLRHPQAARIKGVTLNGKEWAHFQPDKETIDLAGLKGKVTVVAHY